MGDPLRIDKVDAYRVSIPLARPYRLSKVYGTLTHCDVVLLRLTTAGGAEGWGEADPGGPSFTGDTADDVMRALRDGAAGALLGASVAEWPEGSRECTGSLGAAVDVAAHDALARATDRAVWELLGSRRRDDLGCLWPTSSGSAREDLETIRDYAGQGFATFMLKAGERDVADDVARVREVVAALPGGVGIMVDANQGWTVPEAGRFLEGVADLPLLLVEQPVAAADLDGLVRLRAGTDIPISADESVQTPEQARALVEAGAVDVFSVKVSKNGGLGNARAIAAMAREAGMGVLMNSMIELGVTQAASLQLGATLDNVLDCGHAYMSTLRMADDVTDFGARVSGGRARIPDGPGLGIDVDPRRIARYQVEACHA